MVLAVGFEVKATDGMTMLKRLAWPIASYASCFTTMVFKPLFNHYWVMIYWIADPIMSKWW
jgi:hypothetical protein